MKTQHFYHPEIRNEPIEKEQQKNVKEKNQEERV